MFILPPLPYDLQSLSPSISAKTLHLHHGKHHQAYIDNLNKLIDKTDLEKLTLEEIIKKTFTDSAKVGIYHNAGQVFNHNFYWKSIKPHSGGSPTGKLLEQINKDFGSFEKFSQNFKEAGAKLFGSGWVWLVYDGKKLSILSTSNADNPLTKNLTPLLTMDVWEHAYYLDYQNERKKYVDAFVDHLINWEFVESNFLKFF
jgi:superoxide dismutase, Fe-Mn family